MILLYLVSLELILELDVIFTYVYSRCVSLSLLWCFTDFHCKNELQSTALLKTKASWILKTILSSEQQPWWLRFHRCEGWPPSEGLGRRQGDEITARDLTFHSRHVFCAISRMCKSNLNPCWELLHTENPSAAEEISKLQHENGKWTITSWLLRNTKSKIQCGLNF